MEKEPQLTDWGYVLWAGFGFAIVGIILNLF